MTYCFGFVAVLAIIAGTSNAQVYLNGVNMGNYYVSTGEITIANGVIQCGTVTCPPNSYQCTVTKQSYDNNQFVQMTNTCTNNGGAVTYSGSVQNPNPVGYPVQTFAMANLNGNTLSCDTCSNQAEAEAKVKQTVGVAMQTAGRVYNNAMATAARAIDATRGLGDRIRQQVFNNLRAAGL